MLDSDHQSFARNFVRDYTSPYATQQPGKPWRTKYIPVSDPLIEAHLAGHYWLGTKACWYPVFFNLDVDHPTSATTERIYERLERLGISESQRVLMTSPSHSTSGNYRIYLRPEYAGKPPTWKLGYDALHRAFGDVCEVYPQKRRKDRLPCGREQDVIVDGCVLRELSWREELHHLLKLDPVPVENLPRQLRLELPPPALEQADHAPAWTASADVAALLRDGLQEKGTRHQAQFTILNHLWRANWQPSDAAAHVKRWLRTKHNGYSKDAARGAWRGIEAEIERQVKWIWGRPQSVLPDTPHNLQGAVTKADLELAAGVFRGDAVRQKQLVALCGYYRARAHHEWVYVSRRIWCEEIAGTRTYQRFIGELEERGLLRSVNSYKVGEYSRKYKLELPATSEPALQRDERHVTEFYEALKQAFPAQREMIALTGLNERTMRRHSKGF